MSRNLDLGPWRLRFVDPSTEADFRVHHLESQLTMLRVIFVFTAIQIVFLAFCFVYVVPETQVQTYISLLGILAPWCFGIALWSTRPSFFRGYGIVAPLFHLTFTVVVIWLAIFAPDEVPAFHYGAITASVCMLVYVGTNFIALRALPAMLTVLPYVLFLQGVLSLSMSESLPMVAATLYTALLWASVTLSAIAVYTRDTNSRDSYVKDQLLEAERRRGDALLHNILPAPIVVRLKSGETQIADSCADATILFADLVGFTTLSQTLSAEELVGLLSEVFVAFDDLATAGGIEKIKTIGDAYMAVAGVPVPRDDHAQVMATMALGMVEALQRVNASNGSNLHLRVGLHSGPVVAGVIGKSKFAYDLWGDAVNTASRMESHGLPDRVQISKATRERLGDEFALESRGTIEVKGKGEMETWLLSSER